MRRPRTALIVAIAAAVLIADQVSKALVRAYLAPLGAPVRVIGDVVRLNFTQNEGAAFGMLPGNRLLFIPVHVIVLLVVAVYAWRRRPRAPWLVIALGLVAGGALGNLVDRVVFGWVTDFIQIPFNFPVFNIADSAVVVGVAMLVWWLLFGPPSKETAGAVEHGEPPAPACENGAQALDAPSRDEQR